MNILAFESSCDETAVAVVRDGRQVLSDAILSQADMHALYGGVVPEIASRKHVEAIAGLTDQALAEAGVGRSDIDAVAVTYGPGLIGALLVGVNFAKSAACALGKPLIPVHHLRDEDTCDYGFYTYGLSLYGNMPLIEPQETREARKIEEFAIVVDTSMSCSGALVRRFLEETYSVLSENESFFRKVNIHIIQCDEKVHQDVKITSQEELGKYMEHFQLYGEGGTDFRPAFEYVDSLIETGEYTNLKGLIYFTDGYGIYPNKMPPYRTAFVFLEEDYRDVDVPPWAVRLVISGDSEIERG